MRNRRKRKNIKYFLLPVLIIIFSIGIFYIINRFVFGKNYIVSPVPISLYSNGKKIFLSNVSDNALESMLRKNNILYSTITPSFDSSYIIKLVSGEEIIISSKKDLNLQVSSLQLILNRLKIEGKRFTRLDLRFDKPVVVFR